MVKIISAWLFAITLASSCFAQISNGMFSSGDLSGWTHDAIMDSSPSLFLTVLRYGVNPVYDAFRSSKSEGVIALDDNAIVTMQADNYDGNGPFISSTAIAAPSGKPIAFISNHDANAATDGNTLVGSSIFQTFFVPSDATTLTFLARQLSNEGLDTASDTGGQTVGADFGGVALHSGNTVFHQVTFDEQSSSAADFHVSNFSPDGSIGFGGFVSGTDWQSLSFDLTALRGQNVTLTAYEVNTGDTNFESRLLLANVVMNRTGSIAAPEPGSLCLLAGCLLFVKPARRRSEPSPLGQS